MLKKVNKKRNRKGFTLVELVVVIAILGILAAIAIPRLSKSRDSAQNTAKEATTRTLNSAVSMYLAEIGEEKLGQEGFTVYQLLEEQGYLQDTLKKEDFGDDTAGKISYNQKDYLFKYKPIE